MFQENGMRNFVWFVSGTGQINELCAFKVLSEWRGLVSCRSAYKVLVLLCLSQPTSLDLSQKWTFTHPLISIELSYEVTRPHKLTSFDFYTKIKTNTVSALDSVQFWTFIHLYKYRAFLHEKTHTQKTDELSHKIKM